MERKVGVQVLVTAHNASKYLSESLDSILPAINQRPWVFIFHDDGSTDDTYDIARKFEKKSGADTCVIKKSLKCSSIGQAKNITFNLINTFRSQYPYICVHDSDDLMYESRIDGLAAGIATTGTQFVFGSYYIRSPKISMRVSATKINNLLGFGVWNTLFHESLIPPSGQFFRTDMSVFEDHAKWWEMRYSQGIEMSPIEDVMTTLYIKRSSSMTLDVSQDQIDKLKSVRNSIYKHPLTA